MKKNAFQTYQRVSIATADPVRIVVMLYEGMIRNLNQTLEHFESGKKAEGSDRIKRTLDIVHYLTNALDHDKGTTIASNLERLYDFVRDTLNEANIQCDPKLVRDAMRVLQPLLEGWTGLAAQTAAEQAASAPQSERAMPRVTALR